jgi:hypothetical protein
MKVVYEAANLIDAHLVKHALEETGMPVFLRGEALLGGMGELPLFGVVAICVPTARGRRARSSKRCRSPCRRPGGTRRRARTTPPLPVPAT